MGRAINRKNSACPVMQMIAVATSHNEGGADKPRPAEVVTLRRHNSATAASATTLPAARATIGGASEIISTGPVATTSVSTAACLPSTPEACTAVSIWVN